MAADVLVSRELKSLQEELSAAKKSKAAAGTAPAADAAASPEPPPASAGEDEPEFRDQLRQFAHELTGLFDEAEKTISTHPAQSVVGALLLGILIGRLLGRR